MDGGQSLRQSIGVKCERGRLLAVTEWIDSSETEFLLWLKRSLTFSATLCSKKRTDFFLIHQK